MKYLKQFTLVGLLGIAFAAQADDQAASTAFFRPLRLDPESVRLIAATKGKTGHHFVRLSFRVLPVNGCQELYAGLMELGRDDYQVVWGEPRPSFCAQFARPKVVEHDLIVDVTPGDHRIRLNGQGYRFVDIGGKLVLEKT